MIVRVCKFANQRGGGGVEKLDVRVGRFTFAVAGVKGGHFVKCACCVWCVLSGTWGSIRYMDGVELNGWMEVGGGLLVGEWVGG